jgi:hypothetical protein
METPNSQITGFQPPLPNSSAILVIGILSIVLCCCFGIIGIILAIIALIMAGKANNLFMQNPEYFSVTSFNNMKAGKICAIIGLIMSIMVLIYFLISYIFLGITGSGMPWDVVDA